MRGSHHNDNIAYAIPRGTCPDHNRLNDLDDGTNLLHRRVNSLLRFLRREETGAERYIREDGGYDNEGKTIAASRPVNAL